MVELKIKTVKEKIYWSYANLAMAHTAVDRKQNTYERFNYMIRAKLFKGLKDGSMNIRSLFYDEKIKLLSGQVCSYCGSNENLTIDHIFPRKYGGKDNGDNLIYACRKCNSSKGKKDLMEWMSYRKNFLPLMIIRRYLKLLYNYCIETGILNLNLSDIEERDLPFKIELLPTNYPNPNLLILFFEDS